MAKQTNIVKGFRDLQREYQGSRQDYAASTPSRFRRQRSGLWGSGDAHYAIERKYFEAIEYVRDMERNDPLLKSTLDIGVNQQVQGGFRFDPLTGDEALNGDLKHHFEDWANDPRQCDVTGEKSFGDMTEQALRSQTRDGDHFVLGLESGHLQEMESERVKTPQNSRKNIVHGVLLNELRQRVGYFFTKGEVDPMTRIERVGDMRFVPTFDEDGYRQVFHVYHPKRVTQTRGVSEFIAIQDRMGILEDIEFSLVIKQQIAAMLVASKESDVGAADGAMGPREVMSDGSNAITQEQLSPGTIFKMAPGQQFKLHSANIPSTETLEHMRRIIQMVGLQAGMPLVMILMDAAETNFSGWRGAVDIARTLFRSNQKQLARKFCSGAAVFWMRWRMRAGDGFARSLKKAFARLERKLFAHQWHFPGWPYIQPLQDVQADALKLTSLISSPRRVCADRGYTFKSIVDETLEDNYYAIVNAIKLAQKIEKEQKTVVHYRELLNRDLYHGGQIIDSLDQPNAGDATGGSAKPQAGKER